MHISHETIYEYIYVQTKSELKKELIGYIRQQKPKPKAKLKADKANHTLQLDENTQLSGIPSQAWEYKLGNRSALEWVLDHYKESTPQDPTIAARFDTYRFANHKEAVITLLGKVCRVSVETMNIIKQMP
jgi:predicted helicase